MIDNTVRIDLQVDPEHYNNNYDSKERFTSYWHQIQEILLLESDPVLEIGIGNSLVANYLRRKGVDLTALDVDMRLRPDCMGLVQSIPLKDNSYEVVACFEVLEHIPFSEVPLALSEIHRVTRQYAVISIPDCQRTYRFYFHVPKVGTVKKLIPLPYLVKPKHTYDGQHYWELNKSGYPLSMFVDTVRQTGFSLIKTYRVFEYPSHRFFVFESR
jgi:predicted SAM-dependent methyltransferase